MIRLANTHEYCPKFQYSIAFLKLNSILFLTYEIAKSNIIMHNIGLYSMFYSNARRN